MDYNYLVEHSFNNEIKTITYKISQLRSLLTEEMVLNFMITGKNELQLVQQTIDDKIIIRLEKKE